MATVVGFTGTRRGATERQLEVVRSILLDMRDYATAQEFHHGDCVGADEQAADKAHAFGYRVVAHPPTADRYRAWYAGNDEARPTKPYLERDQNIVDTADVLIAAPATHRETLRSGTWATVRRARRKPGCVIHIVYPDGSLDMERIK